MDRATKLIVVASTALALGLLVQLHSRAFAMMLPLSVAAFIGSCLATALVGDVVLSAVLFFTYLAPALFLILSGKFTFFHVAPWLAAVLGAMLWRSIRTGWACPRPWKAPVVLWALSLALSWPIVVAREIDFSLALLSRYDLRSSRLDIPPPAVVVWVLSMTCIALLSLLWFDWLFSAYSRDRLKRFESRIVWPLFASGMIASAVAVYQAFGHITFLNPAVYGELGRASGTMVDANAFGTMLALWVPLAGARAFEASCRRSWTASAWLAVLLVLGIGVWSTGSRTALLAALIGMTVLVGGFWQSWRAHRTMALTAAGGLAVFLVGVILLMPTSTTGPLRRVRELVPDLSEAALRHAASELWERNGYGPAAVRLISEHPFVGVGVGSFHVQQADAVYLNGYPNLLRFDNAQNWYRHQLAELGLLGSVGWMAWHAAFIWRLVRRSGPGDKRATVGAAKGAVVGLGAASLLGMPTQEPAVAFTFVLFAFWGLRLAEGDETPAVGPARLARRQWIVIGAVVGCFLTGTAYASWTSLRPPYRALRADWNLRYGFHATEPGPPPFRWTGPKAVDVFPAEKPWLKLVIGAVAPDAQQQPVYVKVWRDRDLILRVKRRDDSRMTRYVRVPEGQKRIMMQIEVSRTWRSSGARRGAAQRELGVAVDTWTFVDDPPAGAIVIR